jgi:hypothetical protein
MAIVSTALWLNIPIPFETNWLFIPMYFFAIFTPYYVFAFAIIVIYIMIKNLQIDSLGKRKSILFNRFVQLFGYLFILFIAAFSIYVFFPLIYLVVDIISDIEMQSNIDRFESFLSLIINDPWIFFSVIINCFFHIPRLILIFQYGMLSDKEIKKMDKKSKSRFKMMGLQIERHLQPVGSLILAVIFGVLNFILIPLALAWVFWNYKMKKKNMTMKQLPWSDSLLGLLIVFLSFFAVLWIVGTFQVIVWSFMPIAIIYALINIKFILEDAGVKLELG